MRQLFLVLAKVVGLIQIFTAVSMLAQGAAHVAMLVFISGGKELEGLGSTVGIYTLYFAFSAIFARALLFHTEKLASWVGIQDGEPIFNIEKTTLLWIGGTLLGLFLVVISVGELLSAVKQSDAYFPTSGITVWPSLLPPGVQLCLSLLLVFRMKSLAEWLINRHK